jgi:hypothetical protein
MRDRAPGRAWRDRTSGRPFPLRPALSSPRGRFCCR